jgi:hypothetical protein
MQCVDDPTLVFVCFFVGMYVCVHACMYVSMYVCMQCICMYTCMHVCIHLISLHTFTIKTRTKSKRTLYLTYNCSGQNSLLPSTRCYLRIRSSVDVRDCGADAPLQKASSPSRCVLEGSLHRERSVCVYVVLYIYIYIYIYDMASFVHKTFH